MAAIVGRVNSADGAFDGDAAVTAWEAKPNITTVEKHGMTGADVEAVISTNVAHLKVTTVDTVTADWAAQINDVAFGSGDLVLAYDVGSGTLPDFPFVVVIDTEHLQVTSQASGTATAGSFNVTRGYDGTTAAAHADNAAIATVVAADDITDRYAADDVITGVTFQTANGEAAPA
jgi:hypothetical protein